MDMEDLFNLENTDDDKYNGHMVQLKQWSQEAEPEHQMVFLTIDNQKLVCNSKLFCIFSPLIREILDDFRDERVAGPYFITVPVTFSAVKSMYQLITCGSTFISNYDDWELIMETTNFFGIHISDEEYSKFEVKQEDQQQYCEDNNLPLTLTSPGTNNPINFVSMNDSNLSNLEETEYQGGHAMMEQSQMELYPCSECNKSYARRDVLKNHMKRHHSYLFDVSEIHPCTYCANVYSSRDKLNRHLIIHTAPDGKPFQCLECNTSFSRKDALQRHMKRTHAHISSTNPTKQDQPNNDSINNIKPNVVDNTL